MTYFKNLPFVYCNLNLLRDSFGSNNQKILDLLLKVDVGKSQKNKNRKTNRRKREIREEVSRTWERYDTHYFTDLAATLLNALSIGNPSLGADLRHHTISHFYLFQYSCCFFARNIYNHSSLVLFCFTNFLLPIEPSR